VVVGGSHGHYQLVLCFTVSGSDLIIGCGSSVKVFLDKMKKVDILVNQSLIERERSMDSFNTHCYCAALSGFSVGFRFLKRMDRFLESNLIT